MAGHAYITAGDPDLLKDVAIHVAGGMGYGVEDMGPGSLKISQGSFAASIFLGAFIAYCDFQVQILVPGDGTSHLVLERNNPWWTGVIGVNRVKKRARELADAYGNELVARNVQIVRRDDF